MDSQKSFFGTPKKAFVFIICVLAVLSVFIIGTTFAVTFIVRSSANKNEYAVKGGEGVVYNDEKMAENIDVNQESPVVEDGSTVMREEGSNIGLDGAKAIAAIHAGFSVSEVNFSKAKLEKEHKVMVYEIEFYKDGMEYEYEIDAVTGEIIKYESEWDD